MLSGRYMPPLTTQPAEALKYAEIGASMQEVKRKHISS